MSQAKYLLMAGCTAVSIAGTHDAHAQEEPVAFGVQGGLTRHTSGEVNLGYHAGALARWNGSALPVGLRGDVMYHRFSVKDADQHESITAGTVNAVWALASSHRASMSPYLMGGVGYYHVTISCSSCQSENTSANKLGFNGGAGLSFPRNAFSPFVEVRYHHILTDDGATGIFPVSAGIMFR